MNKATYTFSLDVNEAVEQVLIPLKVGETGRKFVISLQESGQPYIPEADCRAYIYAMKPDDTAVINACIIRLTDGAVMYEVSPQLSGTTGIVRCELKIIGNDETVICSPTFLVNVNETAITDDDITSSSDLQAITDILTKYEKVLDGVAVWSQLVSGCYVCHNAKIKATAATIDNLAEVDGYLYVRKDGNGDGSITYLDECEIVIKHIPADLQNVETTRVDIEDIETTDNKVTSLSSGSTDTEYPSAKAVYLLGEQLRAFVYERTVVETSMSNTSPNPVQNRVVKNYIDSKTVIDTAISDNSPNPVQNRVVKNYIDNKTRVDDAMSSSSMRPVQNRVVKDYIDSKVVPGGVIDTAMSDSSTNAVQNEVIKNYVDGKTIVDSAMSDSSTNAVQNKVIKNYVDSKNNPVVLWEDLAYTSDVISVPGLTDYHVVVLEVGQGAFVTNIVCYKNETVLPATRYGGIGFISTSSSGIYARCEVEITNPESDDVTVTEVAGKQINDGTDYNNFRLYKITGIM